MSDLLDEAFDAMWGMSGLVIEGVAGAALLLILVLLSPLWLPLFALRRLRR